MRLKGKRIVCFVALPHHTRFLWPLTEIAEKQGAEIVFLTTMSDYPFERDLMKKGKKCKIIQSYVNPETRKRVNKSTIAFYKDWVKSCFKWDGYRHWPLSLQCSLNNHAFEEYYCLENFFEEENPDMILMLHERNRWGKLFGHYSRRFGVPFVTLQEGDYYEDRISFSSHTEYSTALMLWGEFTRTRLVNLKSTPEKMVNIGNTHLSTIKAQYFNKKAMAATRKELKIPKGKPVVLFMVGLQWGVIKDEQIWLDFMGDLPKRDDIVPLFKWHPKVVYHSYKKNAEDMFKKNFPNCIVVQNYDAYKLLPIADYCVAMGKTTLAVEALSFGKQIFSVVGTDNEQDQYAQWGVSQEIDHWGDWSPLYNTIENGVPEDIQVNIEAFLDHYFYRRNTLVKDRALEVIEHIFEQREKLVNMPLAKSNPDIEVSAGRVSYVVPSGDDPAALFLTLKSLQENAEGDNWEAVIVVSDPAMQGPLKALQGDVIIIDGVEGQGLGGLYNCGAQQATGATLVFIRPGIAWHSAAGLAEQASQAVTGIRLYNEDMSPYSLGLHFDFNTVPVKITTEGLSVDAVGGGLIAMSRALFEQVGHFDDSMADNLIEADLCLMAQRFDIPCGNLAGARGFSIIECFSGLPRHDANGRNDEDDWRGRVGFFAKWLHELPKDEDYLAFAEELLRV